MQLVDNYVIQKHQTLSDLPLTIQQLFFYNYENERVTTMGFTKYAFSQLTSITTSKNSLKNVRVFVIDDLPKLQTVKIGCECFRMGWRKERDDGICRITNCPNLRQLEIGDHSFGDFKSFELSNVNSLQSIKFGRECFEYCEYFSLNGEWKGRV